MIDLLELRGYDAVVLRDSEDHTINLYAKLLIKSSLDDKHLAEVRNYATAKEMWQHLSRMCIGTNSSDVTTLVNKFYSYQFNSADNMATHLEKLSTMREQLRDVEQCPTDLVYIDRILKTLPSEYSTLKNSWEYMHPTQKTLEELKIRILSMEEKLKQSQPEDNQRVLMLNRNSHNSRQKLPLAELKKRTHCAKCGHKGHWAKECHTKPENYAKRDQYAKDRTDVKTSNAQRNRNQQFNKHSSQAGESDAIFMVNSHSMKALTEVKLSENLLSTQVFRTGVSAVELEKSWLADSGSTAHICKHRSWFTEIELYSDPQYAAVGDNRKIEILGIGNVEVLSQVGNDLIQATIKQVLYVPSLSTNLLSLGQIDSRGIAINMHQGKLELAQGNRVLAQGSRLPNRLWLMDFKMKPEANHAALLMQTKRSLDEWHKTLGHASLPRVVKAVNDNKLEITDKPSKNNCSDCPAGKAKCASHPSRNKRATEVGERVFVDLAGPIEESHNGFKYFMLSKDEYSTYTHVFCLKDKSSSPTALAKLIVDFEIETGKRIQRLHSDQGSEFYGNNRIELTLAVEHIAHETSATYTPQQNGVIEREIQSVTQMARTMLLASDVPGNMWEEAVKTACFIRNRLPNKIVNSSPYELATGRKPALAHLCEFGRQVHVVINDRYLKKFDPRTEEGYIVGFTLRSNTYRVYIKDSRRVISSCNIIFKPHKSSLQQIQADEQILGTYKTSLPQTTTKPKSPLDIFFEEILTRGSNPNSTFYEDAEDGQGEASGQSDPEVIVNQEQESPQDEPVEADEQTCSDGVEEVESPPFSPLTNNESVSTVAQDEVEQAFIIVNKLTEPQSYAEAISGPSKQDWSRAIAEEFAAHEKNETWEIADRPSNKNIMTTKWVFKLKLNPSGQVERHKARLVARGFEQRAGLDYGDTFAPVAKYETIRILIALAAQEDLIIEQFDITTAFLYGKLEDEVYIYPPEGLTLRSDKVLKLKKGLYGLKQAPRVWNEEFNHQIEKLGFKATKSDNCLYSHKDKKMLLCIYVDDGLLLARSREDIDQVMMQLKHIFNIRIINNSTFVGLQIERITDGYVLHQKIYAKSILEKYRMENCCPVSAPLTTGHKLTDQNDEDTDAKCPYREAIGSLLFLSKTRPDILYATTILARYCENPKEKHWTAIKRVMRYIKATTDTGLVFKKQPNLRPEAYTDADWASDPSNRRSTTGTIILLANGPVIFRSCQQGLIALSTTESEFIAAAETVRDLLWLKTLLKEVNQKFEQPLLRCDSQSAISLINNSSFSRRTKHIDIKYHYVREQAKNGEFSLEYVSTKEQLADFLTKALPRDQHKELTSKANIIPMLSERRGVLEMRDDAPHHRQSARDWRQSRSC